MSSVESALPYFVKGCVVKGFGRGSKELGVPTANFPDDVVENIPLVVSNGIYYGWASVDNGPIYKAVMSLGYNPFYGNTKRTLEVNLLHTFDADFYGSLLKSSIVGFIRTERNFSSLDELKEAIANDIAIAKEKLSLPENQAHTQLFSAN